MPVASIFEDAWDAVTETVSDAWDGVGDAVRALPGGAQLLEAARDFANTSTGLTVLRAFSTMLYGSIAWTLGPQLASVAFAVPGLFRGDRFEQAWLTEVKWRAEETAKIAGPGIVDAWGAQLSGALQKLAAQYDVGDLVSMAAPELAKRFNVREDVAAFALAIWNRVQLPSRNEFDPVSGRQLGAWQAAPSTMTPCEAYADRRRRFGTNDPRPDIASQLRAACESSPESRAAAAREYQVLYGAKEYDALGLASRERAALTRASGGDDPAAGFFGVEQALTAGTVVLAGLAGVSLVVWLYARDRKR